MVLADRLMLFDSFYSAGYLGKKADECMHFATVSADDLLLQISGPLEKRFLRNREESIKMKMVP